MSVVVAVGGARSVVVGVGLRAGGAPLAPPLVCSWSAAGRNARRTRRVEKAPRRSGAVSCAGVVADGVAVVVGASGNVGRLVARRLAAMGYEEVRCVSRRAPEELEEIIGVENGDVTFVKADTREPATLSAVMENARVCVVCTGVTAFKTDVWEDGANSPKQVDADGVRNCVEAFANASAPGKRRFVLMSSVGVTRRTSFPYIILNGAGVLDAKAEGEEAVAAVANANGFEYTVVRPGQLVGGPYENNRYLGTLFEIEKSNKRRVVLARGDGLVGDTSRAALAEVLAQACAAPGVAGLDFGVVTEAGDAVTESALLAQLAALPSQPPSPVPSPPRVALLLETLQKAAAKLLGN